MNDLIFRVDLSGRARGELHVRLTLPPAAEWRLALPRWTPGSYVLRDFARHLMDLRSADAVITRPDPHQVHLEVLDPDSPTTLEYSVYARELTVRTAFATHDWAFWNGACLYLWPTIEQSMPATVEVALDPSCSSWSVHSGHGGVPADDGLARVRFENQDDAVDTPILCGGQLGLDLSVGDLKVRFVDAGAAGLVDWQQLESPVRAILGEVVSIFGSPIPVEEYHFLALFGEEGRGGLEHADSSTLLAARTFQGSRRERQDYLGLIAHEFLHLWNVKRMRPVELWNFDYQDENPTRLLWVAEGFTAYFDDLCCVRAGAFDEKHYFERLAEHVNNPWADTALGDASLEAWTKLYKGGENLRNNSVNYYVDGALAGLVLDVAIRTESADRQSLEDLMRDLYDRTFREGRGYVLEDVAESARRVGGDRCADLVLRLDREPVRPLLESTLAELGLHMESVRPSGRLGIRMRAGSTEVASVERGRPAWNEGLRAGDELLALNGFRVRAGSWRQVLDRCLAQGEELELLFSREGRIEGQSVRAESEESTRPEWRLVHDAEADRVRVARRRDWLAARRARSSQ